MCSQLKHVYNNPHDAKMYFISYIVQSKDDQHSSSNSFNYKQPLEHYNKLHLFINKKNFCFYFALCKTNKNTNELQTIEQNCIKNIITTEC